MPAIKKFKGYKSQSFFGKYLSITDFKRLKEIYKECLKRFNPPTNERRN